MSSMREIDSPSELVCNHCQSHFRRREHLERHTRRHLELRPFPCQWCSRSFSRKDSLKRHVATHGPSAVRSYAATASQEAKRVARACMKCTKSKQRCNGQQPCDRCQKRHMDCEYSIPLSSGGEEPRSLPRQPPPPAPIDLAQTDVFHQGTAAPNPVSLDQPGLSQSAGLMECIFNPFPFMLFDNVDPSLGGFPASFFPDANPNSAGFSNENGHSLPYETPIISSFDDVSKYPNGQSIPGTSMVGDLTALPTNSSYMNATQETATMPGEHRPQRQASTIISSGMTLDEQEILATEDFCHVERISEDAYNAILGFYREHCQKSITPQPTVPSIQAVNTFVQLYFEYFHPVMPIIHLASFKPAPDKWILLAAIASVGCQYSRIPSRSRMHSFFWRLLQSIILNLPMQRLLRNEEVHIAQAVLLHSLSLFDGSKDTVCTMQYQRSILITLCRPFLVGQASPFTQLPATSSKENNESWSHWILSESWKRTIYFTWVLECFQSILFDLPPALAIWELRVGLPSDEALWECSDSGEWECLYRSHEEPTSLVHLISSLKTTNSVQSLSPITRLITIITLYSEDTRLRKESNCLPYSALSSVDSSSQPNTLISNILASQFQHLDPELSTLSMQQQKIYHLLSILRHIPPTTLYASYGWMTTKSDAEIADSHVAELIKDAKRAGESLVHAAHLFRIIREQNIVAFYDPFCLLFSTLYICKYTRHALDIPREESESGEPRTPGSRQPVRIDRLNDEDQKAWIQGCVWAGDVGIHVTGIGVLGNPGTSSRAFKEAARILRGSMAWARISQAMARSLMQSLRGEALIMPAS